MTFVVAYDGTALSERGLALAATIAPVHDQDVVAVTVVPRNEEYARDHDWLEDDQSFDVGSVVGRIERRVHEIDPGAGFEYEVVDRYAPPGEIASDIRSMARSVNATLVFVGSEDAGRIATPVTSVGGTVSSGPDYDVYIVRPQDDDDQMPNVAPEEVREMVGDDSPSG